jgi:biopolymer transport protein ExbD
MNGTNLRPRRRETPDLNMTSLIDVVLLLLVFFMLSTTFNRFAELHVELPYASAETHDQDSRPIDLTIDREGRYYVNRREVEGRSAEVLNLALKQALQGRSDVVVQISADARTQHQAVITAMDAARQAGLLHIAFATAQDSQAAP